MQRLLLSASVALTLAAAPGAFGAVIANYEFSNGGSAAATSFDPGVTAGDFTVTGDSLTIAAMDGSRTSPSGPNTAYASLATANAAFSLTLTPDANQQLTITDVEIYTGKSSSGGSTGAFSYQIGDGPVVSVDSSYSIPRVAAGGALALREFAITGIVGVTQPVTFFWDPVPTDRVYMDDVFIEGSVAAIPEPAAVALLGLAAIPMLRRRRA